MHRDRLHTEQTKPDPIHAIYLIAEAVEHLKETLPPEQGGLAYLLRLIGRDAKEQARALDNAEGGELLKRGNG